MSRPIILVTGNQNKLKEFLQVMGSDFPHRIEIKDVDLPEYQGEPEEVARTKCLMAAEHVKGPVIVEDTSLCYNALGGMPGPYIKWFLKKMGTQGLHKLLKGFEDKTAYAQCVYAYSSGEKDAPIHCFSGKCDGTIVEPRGPTDFGWDPVFQPEGYDKTFAELDKAIKNQISHRYKATTSLKEFLKTL